LPMARKMDGTGFFNHPFSFMPSHTPFVVQSSPPVHGWPAVRPKYRLISVPAEMPADVTIRPSSTQRWFSTTEIFGKHIPQVLGISSQWVVTTLPSSKPALASRKAPVQTEAVIVVRHRLLIHSITGFRSSCAVTIPPGTISTSRADESQCDALVGPLTRRGQDRM